MNRSIRQSALPAAEFTAPFVSDVMTVEPQWIDYNGHLNMAYYNVLFDRGVDQAILPLGLGPEQMRTRHGSVFTAEAHVCYLRELHVHMPVRVSFQILDHDGKRIHAFQELLHAEEGWTSATSELMLLHVDTEARRVAPWPDDVAMLLARMKAAHSELPIKPQVGRTIGIKR